MLQHPVECASGGDGGHATEPSKALDSRDRSDGAADLKPVLPRRLITTAECFGGPCGRHHRQMRRQRGVVACSARLQEVLYVGPMSGMGARSAAVNLRTV